MEEIEILLAEENLNKTKLTCSEKEKAYSMSEVIIYKRYMQICICYLIYTLYIICSYIYSYFINI